MITRRGALGTLGGAALAPLLPRVVPPLHAAGAADPEPRFAFTAAEEAILRFRCRRARARSTASASRPRRGTSDSTPTRARSRTMRMGTNPSSSVVDRNGRYWGAENLYVMDGSLMVSAGGYNPTETIQALAWMLAERLL